jgi:hypothetical protein
MRGTLASAMRDSSPKKPVVRVAQPFGLEELVQSRLRVGDAVEQVAIARQRIGDRPQRQRERRARVDPLVGLAEVRRRGERRRVRSNRGDEGEVSAARAADQADGVGAHGQGVGVLLDPADAGQCVGDGRRVAVGGTLAEVERDDNDSARGEGDGEVAVDGAVEIRPGAAVEIHEGRERPRAGGPIEARQQRSPLGRAYSTSSGETVYGADRSKLLTTGMGGRIARPALFAQERPPPE